VAQQQPQQASSPQQNPQVQAQIAAIYAEAQAQHWSEAQINLAITKALEQSGPSSSSGAQASLIDVNA
jgi:hypothetical protein